MLERFGYSADAVDMLSEGQIAEVYLTATSEDETAVRRIIDGFKLSDTDAPVDTMAPSGVEMTVAEALEQNGYSGDMVNALSSGDIASIYTAYTSEDQAAVNEAISSAIEVNSRMSVVNPSDAEERAIYYLARQGVPMDQIDDLDSADLTSIFVALSSGDETEIQRAVTSAIDS